MTRILIDVAPHDAGLARLRSVAGLELVFTPPEAGSGEDASRPLPASLLAGTEILFCVYPPTNFSDLTGLKWIQIASAGYNQLYGLPLAAKGIRATNARGCFDVPIAEWNVAMMINLRRNLRQMIRNQDRSVWDRAADFQQEVRGMTVGIWGYGGIGRETARLAKALGMEVLVMSRAGIGPLEHPVYVLPGTGDPEGVLPDGVFLSGQEEAFLSELDFLVLSMPLMKSTEGIIGARELKALPSSAFVLNPARGPLIDEAALLQALGEGWIAGAAIDTHYSYPLPAEHPLWRLPNVILTPHISGSSLSERLPERLWDIFNLNVRRY
ncbi:MAG: D-2-hydroxyacid dehydrogenase, partial [Trueperaceae bacterium]